MGLRSNDTLWTWGTNNQGRLGLGSDAITYKNTPTQVGTDTWEQISAGANHAAAIRKGSKKLYLWGQNSSGQLGVGDYVNRNAPTQEAGNLTWKSVSCGDYHTVAIQQTSNRLYAWGSNFYGQLGIGNTDVKNTPTIVSDDWKVVAAGKYHTIGIKTNDALYGWGHNNVGQVGNDALTDAVTPNLLDLGPWGIVVAGGDTSMAIKGDDTVWVWGDNVQAQHANVGREVSYRKTPTQISALDGTQASFWTRLSVSPWSVGLVKQGGTLWTWGTNEHRRLSRDLYTKEPARSIVRLP
jgi:alpha-tubulin suppressor-like RCC1 family protein